MDVVIKPSNQIVVAKEIRELNNKNAFLLKKCRRLRSLPPKEFSLWFNHLRELEAEMEGNDKLINQWLTKLN